MRFILSWSLGVVVLSFILFIGNPVAKFFWEFLDRPLLLVPFYSFIFLSIFTFSISKELRTYIFPWRSAAGYSLGLVLTLLLLFITWDVLPVHGNRQGEDLSVVLLIAFAVLLLWFFVLAWISAFVGWAIGRRRSIAHT